MTIDKKDIHLSKDINPLHYKLTMQPDLTMFVFTGEETIELEVKKSTKSITLHADELDVTTAVFNDSLEASIKHNEESETVTFTFPKQLPVGKGNLLSLIHI